MRKIIGSVAMEKALGNQPSRVRAALAAGAIGTASAGVVYRLLRRATDEDA
jgi:hypothetical protein